MTKPYFDECMNCTVPQISGKKLAVACPGNGSTILLCQKSLAEVDEQNKASANGNLNK